MTTQEILDCLEELDNEVDSIYITPPNVNVESDFDSADEDEGGLMDNLNGRQLQTEAESVLANGQRIGCSDDHQLQDISDPTPSTSRTTRKKSQKNSLNYDWSRTTSFPSSVNNEKCETQPPLIDLSNKSPVEKFRFFFDDAIIDKMVSESIKYASQNNAEYVVTAPEITTVIGILLLSGYNKVPARRMYWSGDEDLRNEMVAEAMSSKRFEQIMRYLHFADNSSLNKDDRMAKLRPLMDHLSVKFSDAYPMDECIGLDESMIEYFGKHGCKQCIRNKPIRFGYKAWSLNSSLGYLLGFDIYQGSSGGAGKQYEEKFGKGGGTLLSLLDALPDRIKNLPLRIYFDNYFTGLPLIEHLSTMNYGATGTVRDNRIPKSCPIKSTQEMKKSQRGTTDTVADKNNNIALIRWTDNAVVTAASNIHGLHPTVNVTRWSAKDKKKIQVLQPDVLNQYNKYMGGTDRMDQNCNCYRINVRSKKWWWPIFSWLVDVTVQNAWILHRREHKSMSLLQFRREIARTFLLQAPSRGKHGRPRHSLSVVNDVRYDNIGHLVEPRQKQAWKCGLASCKSRPSQQCCKCKVPLCVKCFIPYHQKQ